MPNLADQIQRIGAIAGVLSLMAGAAPATASHRARGKNQGSTARAARAITVPAHHMTTRAGAHDWWDPRHGGADWWQP